MKSASYDTFFIFIMKKIDLPLQSRNDVLS